MTFHNQEPFDAAIDRQALVDVVFNGMNRPTAQAVSSASPYYIASVTIRPHGLAMAK